MNPSERVPGEKIEELLERLMIRGPGLDEAPPHLSAHMAHRGIDCPEDGVWRNIVARQTAAKESRAWVEHAAHCRRCGAILRFWADVAAEDQTPAESAELTRLASMSAGWQERMSRTLCAADAAPRRGFYRERFFWPTVMAVSGAAAAAGLFFVFLGNARSQGSPERLLAEAYAGHRIMETRIPMAGFAPVDATHHVRAAGPAAMSDSVPLLEARAAITQALMKAPEDPHWLLLQARSDLLNESYNTAIETLQRLYASDPGNVAVLTDLASAYLMRSKATEAPTDEATALNFLVKAASLQPNNAIVLYNEAVVLQDLFQYANAMEAWNKFLAVEHDGAWARDGQRRLAEIEAKVKAQQSRLDPLLASPEGMLHLARSPAMMQEYDEEISSDSLPLLLKTAFPLVPSADSPLQNSTPHPVPCAEPCQAARTLLFAAASSLEEHHRDRSLAELLRGSSRPGFAEAVNFLADAVADGLHSSATKALGEARSAESQFEGLGNGSGLLMARVQEIFDFEHLFEIQECLASGRATIPELESGRYPLMAANFWADHANCQALRNDFSAAGADLQRSLRESDDAGYRVVRMRASGFVAANAEAMGDRELAWKLNMQMLRDYWGGDYPAIRRLLPYVNLVYLEQASSRLYSAVAISREAVGEAMLSSGNAQLVDENRFLLVKAEIRAGEMEEAARDRGVAEAELAALPRHNNLRETSADTAILLAEGYLSDTTPGAAAGPGAANSAAADTSAAAAMLRSAAEEMRGSGDREMELRYASAAGHLALLEGHREEAEEKLASAALLAEQGYHETPGTAERMNWIKGAREIYAALAILRLREGESPLKALAVWERYRMLSGGASLPAWCHERDLECLARPLESARESLGGETVAGTIRLDRTLVVWAMDDRGIDTHEEGIDPERFDLLCHTFAETVATPSSSEASIRSYGGQLADVILAPMAYELDPRRTLVFDLDDTTEFLPMAAVPWKGRYLGLEFATSSVHSVLLARRQPLKAQASRASLVVGASDAGDPDVSRLPEARMEALTVAGLLSRPTVLVGDKALASSVEAAVPRASLIHFAGHARFADGGTRLLLARSAPGARDWLDARQFRPGEFAACRLVVLSACATGKREERDSDGIQDIVQTLTAEGAQQVVATHWDVDSAAAVALMRDFYSGLAGGLTVPQALLQAESLISATAEYRHPYYWAPYYATGMSKSNLKELFQ